MAGNFGRNEITGAQVSLVIWTKEHGTWLWTEPETECRYQHRVFVPR
ncbi:hypothetical protein [Spirosoma lituiforme]